MSSVEANNMNSITKKKESATFTTKKEKNAFGDGAGANSATL